MISQRYESTSNETILAQLQQWPGRIREVADRLAHYPSVGRIGRAPGTRELVVSGTPYIVVYTVFGREAVEIRAVMHGARAWPETFL